MFNHIDMDLLISELDCETLPTGRTYRTPEGKKYPSVTTVLSEESKASIMAWRARVGAEEANKISHQASTRGTAVHQLAENYVNNMEDWRDGAMQNNIHSFNQIRPILDKHVDNIYVQEASLYSNKLEVAGTVDLIAEWDGELSVIDYKTSRKPKKEEWIQNYFMQASFYACAWYELTGMVIKQSVIVIAVDHNDPQVFRQKTYDYLKDFIKVRAKYKAKYGI